MTLQSSGPIKASEIQAEFGGSGVFRLSDYYAGGSIVPAGTVGDGGPIPSSGTISFSDFYGASNFDVDVEGGIFIHIAGGSASAGYRLNTSGAEQGYDDGSGSFATFNTWLLALTSADYECRLTVDSGDTPTGSATGSWLILSATRTWELIQNGTGAKANSCTIEIRHTPSDIVIDSASVTMGATAI